MKKTLLISIMIFLCCIQMKSQILAPCEYHENCNVFSDVKIFQIAEYPNCHFAYGYKVIECPNKPPIIEVTYVMALGGGGASGTGCESVEQTFYLDYPNNEILNPIGVKFLMEKAEEHLWSFGVGLLILANQNAIKDLYDCDYYPGAKYEMVMRKNGICKAACVQNYYLNNQVLFPGDVNSVTLDGPFAAISYVNCDEYCCSTVREYCWEKIIVGGEVVGYIEHIKSENTLSIYPGLNCSTYEPSTCQNPILYEINGETGVPFSTILLPDAQIISDCEYKCGE